MAGFPNDLHKLKNYEFLQISRMIAILFIIGFNTQNGGSEEWFRRVRKVKHEK